MKSLESIANKYYLDSNEIAFIKAGQHFGFLKETENPTQRPTFPICGVAAQWIRLISSNLSSLLNDIAGVIENSGTLYSRKPSEASGNASSRTLNFPLLV